MYWTGHTDFGRSEAQLIWGMWHEYRDDDDDDDNDDDDDDVRRPMIVITHYHSSFPVGIISF